MVLVGNQLQNDGTIRYRDGDYINMESLWSYKFAGDPIKMEVLRNGTVINLEWNIERRLVTISPFPYPIIAFWDDDVHLRTRY